MKFLSFSTPLLHVVLPLKTDTHTHTHTHAQVADGNSNRLSAVTSVQCDLSSTSYIKAALLQVTQPTSQVGLKPCLIVGYDINYLYLWSSASS
jgi:hypothetical protein